LAFDWYQETTSRIKSKLHIKSYVNVNLIFHLLIWVREIHGTSPVGPEKEILDGRESECLMGKRDGKDQNISYKGKTVFGRLKNLRI